MNVASRLLWKKKRNNKEIKKENNIKRHYNYTDSRPKRVNFHAATCCWVLITSHVLEKINNVHRTTCTHTQHTCIYICKIIDPVTYAGHHLVYVIMNRFERRCKFPRPIEYYIFYRCTHTRIRTVYFILSLYTFRSLAYWK